MTNIITIPDQRIEAAQRLKTLRRKRGANLLDGKPLDHGPVIEAEEEIDALFDAESLVNRRQREAATEAAKARKADLQGQIAAKTESYFAAIGRAEKATRALGSALKESNIAGLEISKLCKEMGAKPPHGISGPPFDRRISERISAVLRTVTGHPIRFGSINLTTTWRRIEDLWVVEERAELGGDLAAITKEI